MRIRLLTVIIALTLLVACGGGGGGGNDSADDTPVTPPGDDTTVPLRTAQVLAFNDLGMHCMDKEFSVFSILPPFNVVNAQLVRQDASGTPQVTTAQVELTYDAVADAGGSVNSFSIGKTGFWDHAAALFGATLAPGEGLTGLYMPADNPQAPGPQAMDFESTHGWFSAHGIPITPTDDALQPNTYNPYPMLRISAHVAGTGELLARTDVVVPVATETDCQNCHKTGGIAAENLGLTWSADLDLEVQSKLNILILHDDEQGTDLQSQQPVLCAGCHYSPALDLAGAGPQGEQIGKPVFSNVMHAFHGRLDGGTLFPDGAPVEQTCYQCHPGNITQCQRGAMRTGGMQCNACHGGMRAVGGDFALQTGGSLDGTNDGGARRPWQDLPRCQSCHTGDAVDHLSGADLVSAADGIRLRQAYRTGDASSSPILANNKRFAENTATLFRNSKGHGGIGCEGCHGSTHAIWPNATAAANDNRTAIELQGHAGTIMECAVCHEPGSLPLTTAGPHGLHNVNDNRWINGHEDFFEGNANACRACHGLDLLGTPLAKVPVKRSFNAEGRTVTIAKGVPVSCDLCHENPLSGD